MNKKIGSIGTLKGIFTYWFIPEAKCCFCSNLTSIAWSKDNLTYTNPICLKCEYETGIAGFWEFNGGKSTQYSEQTTNDIITMIKDFIRNNPELGLEI